MCNFNVLTLHHTLKDFFWSVHTVTYNLQLETDIKHFLFYMELPSLQPMIFVRPIAYS